MADIRFYYLIFYIISNSFAAAVAKYTVHKIKYIFIYLMFCIYLYF
jgi:hypothetical protein